MKENKTISEKHRKFVNEREDWTDRQIQLSQVYYLRLIQDATERTRSNTSTIVWIVVIGIVISILGALVGL
ncbi:hypothetical protein SAMN04488007_3667 [Maribacter aquivivus]|uniref:Uncharacterized protein n=1 Tax=Maribacter aquivivus TaxID=228958 RepID=A0A1M6USP3_9FLAO|nr:hypothetical protein [Maribacter aquivivus]SHK72235.1 hypothetical protein SAMN04488007_3667 [Maribacter aquivivus]|tara:strand:- start:261 stop:473 length:213 start_codon:yes stop_codon:yes gene_type:complete